VLAAPLVVLLPYRDAGFVADDFFFTSDRLRFGLDVLQGRGWEHEQWPAARYRPITAISFAANRAVAGYRPSGYRIPNFLLHGLNALLLALLVVAIGGSPHAGWIAGLVFAVHPITHENVMWISGRMHPLAALFVLLALHWERSDRGRRRAAHDAVACVLFFLAVWSYEAALVLPAIVFVVEALAPRAAPARAAQDFTGTFQTAARRAAPYAAALAAYLAVRWLAVSSPAGDFALHAPGAAGEDFARRAWTNVSAFATRLLGRGVGLTIAQSRTFWVTSAVTAACAAAAWRSDRARRVMATGAAIVACAFAPFVTYVGYTDRFAYLAAAGFAMLVGAGAGELVGQHRLGTGGAPRQVRRGRFDTRGAARALCAGALAFMLLLLARQLRLAGAQWFEAGALAQSIVDQLAALEPSPAPGAVLRVSDLPFSHGAAYVYITYFDEAVRRRYGRVDLRVVVSPPAPPSAAAGPGAFVWRPATRTLDRR
jgi:hypothetical protein